jgi:hypothetical protein
MKPQRRKKIGRNEPCPCKSGKKYKHCHGSPAAPAAPQASHRYSDVQQLSSFQEAMRRQRTNQQGLGAPIISAEVRGTRFVAVKNRLLHSKNWRTFIDFLGDYIKTAIGKDGWGTKEIEEKRLEDRHPILQWYDKVCQNQREHHKEPGKVYESPITGAVAAYYGLAYDLYCLDHNAELQAKLIERLKNSDNFYGARYEVTVAATLIRAGFSIEFEDENDRGTTHCEFAATSQRTGRKFSVECKHRAPSKEGEIKLAKLGKTLRAALMKEANYDRIVFIDLNFPYHPKNGDVYPPQMELALHHIRKFESNPTNKKDLPPAFLFMTNNPIHHHLDEAHIGYAVMTDGFKIQEFKTDRPYPLHDLIVNRDKHSDIHHLLDSMKRYSKIPLTFDGEIPEFAFGEAQARLIIGRRYMVRDAQGNDCPGVLTTAIVDEGKRTAVCGLTLDSGESGLYTWPLSDTEMAAYQSSPETFFGEVSRNSKSDSPLQLYDFFLNSYKETPKEKILEFFAGRPNLEELRALSQPELAKMYAEACVAFAMRDQKKTK